MNKEEFISELKKINTDITDKQLEQFENYKNLLQEHNNLYNLTSITEDNEIYLKHFFDSIYPTSLKEFKESNTILDIGTGAGFPGIPLSIMNPDKTFTLVESNAKKCNFLKIVCEKLNLNNAVIINDRAENYVKNNIEKFDLCTSRAVSSLQVLSELEIPALKINGYFLPLKSNIEEEINDSKIILNNLNSKLEKIIEYKLPIENSMRTIPVIKKIKKSPEIYPREYTKIIKDLKKKKK